MRNWFEHTKNTTLPLDIPKSVEGVYKKKSEWISWGDFLGTNFISRQLRKYRSYEEAKNYAKSKGIRKKEDWIKHSKDKNFPKDLPVALNTYDEWISSTHFFGPRPPRPSNYRSFEKAKKYTKSKNIKTKEDWFKHTKSKNFPKDIPVGVSSTTQYKNQWISWPDFLGKKK